MRRRWRVKISPTNNGKVGVVYLTKAWLPTWHADGVIVAEISLMAENADQKLAEARATARHYAKQFEELEAM